MLYGLIHSRFIKTIKACLLCFVGKMGKFVSLESFALDYPDRIQFISRGKEQTIFSKPRIDLCDKKELREVGLVKSFVALIKNACCFAYSDLIMLGDKVYYCELKEDPIIGNTSNCTDKCILMADEKWYYRVAIPKEENKLDSGIFLSGVFSWNYYHFTFQVLPKLQMVGEIDSSVPLLVDKKVKEIPSFAALFAICNKQNRPVVVMEEKVRYCVDYLYYISTQTYFEPGHKAGTPYPEFPCRYRPSVLYFLRETMIPRAKLAVYPKRIFIGRKYASGRRPFNEEDCIACAKKYGFEVVFPELMALEEQIGLFNNAEIIIGGSGAAFTNLIYCNKEVKVIVLYKYGPTLGIWQTLVDFIGGDLVHVCETERVNHNPKNDHVSFCINVDKLREVLDAML